MLLVLGELAVQLRQRQVELALDWIPREQNIEADALTNADYSAFDQEKRIILDVEHLPFLILPKLTKVADLLREEIVSRRAAPLQGAQLSRRKRLRESDPWR